MPKEPVPHTHTPSAKALGKRKMVDPPSSKLPYGVFPETATEPFMPMPIRFPVDTSGDAVIAAALKAQWDDEVRVELANRRQSLAVHQHTRPGSLKMDEVWRAANGANYMRELFGDDDDDENPFEGCAIGGGYGTDNTDDIDPDNPFGYDNTQDPDQIKAQTDQLNAMINTLEKSRASSNELVLGSNMPIELPEMQSTTATRRYVGSIKIDPDDLD